MCAVRCVYTRCHQYSLCSFDVWVRTHYSYLCKRFNCAHHILAFHIDMQTNCQNWCDRLSQRKILWNCRYMHVCASPTRIAGFQQFWRRTRCDYLYITQNSWNAFVVAYVRTKENVAMACCLSSFALINRLRLNVNYEFHLRFTFEQQKMANN